MAIRKKERDIVNLKEKAQTEDEKLLVTLAQAELEAARQTQQQAIGEPYQRLGFISDVLSKVPSVQSSLVQATSPTTSPLAQAIGAFMGVGTGLGQLGGMFDWGSGGGGSQPPQTGNLQSNYGLGSLI